MNYIKEANKLRTWLRGQEDWSEITKKSKLTKGWLQTFAAGNVDPGLNKVQMLEDYRSK